MNRFSIRLVMPMFLIWGLAACSPVNTSGKGDETTAAPDVPPVSIVNTVNPNGGEIYLRMASNEGPVHRSSDLKLENGSCFLSNLYDFPDDIFGDSSLDNLTTQALALPSCRPLAIAQALASVGGTCPVTSIPLSAQDKAQISFDPSALAVGLSAADYVNYATTVELSADCVCAVNVEAPLGFVAMKVPPGFALCTQKFPRYSDAALASARAAALALYGIQ